MTTINKDILDILGTYSELSPEDLSLDMPLGDTGIDSLAMVEIIFDIEERFDIDIPDPGTIEERETQFQTPADIASLVSKLVAERDTAS